MDTQPVIPNLLAVIMQLGATIIMILIIKKYTYKMYLEYMNKRTTFVNEAIETADSNKKYSENVLADLQQEKAEIKSTKQGIFNDVLKEGNLEKENIIGEAKDKARQIITKAHSEVENEKENVAKELSADVLDYVSLVSGKFISSNMTKEDQDKLINEAISKVSNAN